MSSVIHTVSRGELATPTNVNTLGTMVTWDAVQNATSYNVFVTGVQDPVPNVTGYRVMENQDTQGFGIDTTSTSVDLAQPWIPDGTYNVSVIAIGAGTNYSDSRPSSSVSFILTS